MTLNPAVEALLGMMAQGPQLDFETGSVARMCALFIDNPMPVGEPIAMARVEEIAIPA